MAETIENLIAQHADDVWRVAFRLLNHHEDARDCMQQTFLAAIAINDSQVQNWSALLRKIAAGRAIDQLRKRYRERKGLHRDSSRTPSPPDEELTHAELREAVRRTLAGLPELQGQAFWLRHVEQMSTSDVADQLDVREGYVRVLLHRAIHHLRNELGPMYAPEFSKGETHEHS